MCAGYTADGSSILGVCQAINKIDNENDFNEFNGDDVEALQGFATQISIAAQNCIRIRTSKTMKTKVNPNDESPGKAFERYYGRENSFEQRLK